MTCEVTLNKTIESEKYKAVSPSIGVAQIDNSGELSAILTFGAGNVSTTVHLDRNDVSRLHDLLGQALTAWDQPEVKT